MDCQAVYELMNRYIDREITPEEERVLEFHLERCRECQKVFGDLKELALMLNTLEPSKDFTSNVMLKIQESKQLSPKNWLPKNRKGWMGLAAVIVLFVLIFSPWTSKNTQPDIVISQGQVETGITTEGQQEVTIKDGKITIKGLNGTLRAINSRVILENTTADLKPGSWGQLRYKVQQMYLHVKGWFTNTFGKGDDNNESNGINEDIKTDEGNEIAGNNEIVESN